MNSSFDLPHSKFPLLSLSPLIIEDAPEMLIHLNDEQTIKYLIGPPFPIEIEQVKGYISSRPFVNGQSLTYAIRDHNIMIGELSLVPQATVNTYELGYYLARPYWKNGIATAAVKIFLNEMIKQMKTKEEIHIEAGYLADNVGSRKVLEKCGFIKIGYEEKMKNGQTFQGVKMIRIIASNKKLSKS
ncbi:hypothetical protein I4U23_023393 [Adineta vaga]|nr:hypothetical protein I4U23_023393 [Adineta vaga]